MANGITPEMRETLRRVLELPTNELKNIYFAIGIELSKRGSESRKTDTIQT